MRGVNRDHNVNIMYLYMFVYALPMYFDVLWTCSGRSTPNYSNFKDVVVVHDGPCFCGRLRFQQTTKVS